MKIGFVVECPDWVVDFVLFISVNINIIANKILSSFIIRYNFMSDNNQNSSTLYLSLIFSLSFEICILIKGEVNFGI